MIHRQQELVETFGVRPADHPLFMQHMQIDVCLAWLMHTVIAAGASKGCCILEDDRN
jgi:hypothetical protein